MQVFINGRENRLSFAYVTRMAPTWTRLGLDWYFFAESLVR